MTIAVVLPLVAAPRMQRARGVGRVTFKRGPEADAPTCLGELWQEGCAKIRLPRTHDALGPTAVLLNTAGGITGGDHIVTEARWGPRTTATVTTQAAERIYRRSDGVGRVETRLTLDDEATGFWLPQETIVFDRAGLARSLTVDLAPTATFTAVESVVLGRTAMGEDVREVTFLDRWRIRRGGRLIYADQLRLVGDTRSILDGGATGAGARAFATLVRASGDAETRLQPLRDILEAAAGPLGPAVDFGASAFDGLLVVRILAADGRALRTLLEPSLTTLIDGPLPRVWSL